MHPQTKTWRGLTENQGYSFGPQLLLDFRDSYQNEALWKLAQQALGETQSNGSSMRSSVHPEIWRDKKIMVTGHTGFKGVWLCSWLESMGAKVLGYSLRPEGPTYQLFRDSKLAQRTQSESGDISDLPRMMALANEFQPVLVFHLAAQSLVRKSYSEPVSTYATNVMGTVNVLETVRKMSSLKAAVIITTDKCYENKEWLWPYRENDQLGGHDPYSNSKACAELVTDAYRRSYLAESGKLVATARAGNVIGGGDMAEERLVPDAMRAFSRDAVLEIRSPGATRPWQHVLDPLHGYLLLAERLLQGDPKFASAFNFGPADEHTVGEVVEKLAHGWGGGASYQSPAGASLHEASRLHLDSRKAKAELGWSPRLGLDQSLSLCIDFYRQWMGGQSASDLLAADLTRFHNQAR